MRTRVVVSDEIGIQRSGVWICRDRTRPGLCQPCRGGKKWTARDKVIRSERQGTRRFFPIAPKVQKLHFSMIVSFFRANQRQGGQRTDEGCQAIRRCSMHT